MEAIVLAGGLGTRLGELTAHQCKPMVPVAGQPFLAFVLDHLTRNGVRRAIISAGQYGEQIEAYFGNRWRGAVLDYLFDPVPLGTGGAIRHCLAAIESGEALVVNGDTLYEVPLGAMAAFHRDRKADLTMALKPMQKFDRYGAVRIEDERIVGFEEKRFVEDGLINGGIYLIRRDLFDRERDGHARKFSLETDFLPRHLDTLQAYGYVSDTYFIDIGVPEDYARANAELGANA